MPEMLSNDSNREAETTGSSGARVIVGAYVDPRLKWLLVERARRSDRTVSAEIRVALREHLGLIDRREPAQ